MNRVIANLLIVIAFLLLAWAYRLKRTEPKFGGNTVLPPKRRRSSNVTLLDFVRRLSFTGWILFSVVPATG